MDEGDFFIYSHEGTDGELGKGDKCKVVGLSNLNFGSVVTVVDPNWNNMVKIKNAEAQISSYTREDLQLISKPKTELHTFKKITVQKFMMTLHGTDG